jgi:hypothetical protein
MSRENRQLGTMNHLSLRKNRLKFIKTAGKSPIILEDFTEEYIPV